jgi:hypothetical protein
MVVLLPKYVLVMKSGLGQRMGLTGFSHEPELVFVEVTYVRISGLPCGSLGLRERTRMTLIDCEADNADMMPKKAARKCQILKVV